MLPDTERLGALYAAHIEHLTRRIGASLAERKLDALVISAGQLAPKSAFDDQDWPFRPTPAFTHVAPLRDPGSVIVFEPGRKPRLVRAVSASFWDAPPRADCDHIWDALEVLEVAQDGVRAELPAPSRAAFIGDDPDRGRAFGFAEQAINPSDVVADLHAIRAEKTDYERACLREANRRAAAGHGRLGAAFAESDCSELALHLRYLEATGQDDPDTPYKNIVALGENAATLHHVEYERAPQARAETSLLVDAGATCLGYASDITRTWVKGESHTARTFAQLVGCVEAMQREVIAHVAPGVPFEDLHDHAHEVLAGVLRDLDLVRAEPASIVESGATRAFFPHGLGHSLGVQVHDVGLRTRPPRKENPFLRNTSEIATGHVFTIEPGCYFIPQLLAELRQMSIDADVNWSLVDALRPFGGVRIEDNIAVTADGIENLTRPALDQALSGARDPAAP